MSRRPTGNRTYLLGDLEKREPDRPTCVAQRRGSKRDLAVPQLLQHAGLRMAEICALLLSDVEIPKCKGTFTVRFGKGSKHRTVPLSLDARPAINTYTEVRPAARDHHIFTSQPGERLKVQAVVNVVRECARIAGLENVTPHTLRHTFGKQAPGYGVDLVTAPTLVGHQRLERRYSIILTGRLDALKRAKSASFHGREGSKSQPSKRYRRIPYRCSRDDRDLHQAQPARRGAGRGRTGDEVGMATTNDVV